MGPPDQLPGFAWSGVDLLGSGAARSNPKRVNPVSVLGMYPRSIHPQSAAQIVWIGVTLTAATAARVSNPLRKRPPFAPAARRCAFTFAGQGLECSAPAPAFTPPKVAFLDCCVRPVSVLHISPGRAGSQDAEEATQDLMVVFVCQAKAPWGKQRFKLASNNL